MTSSSVSYSSDSCHCFVFCGTKRSTWLYWRYNEGNIDSESFVFAAISLNFSTFLPITLRHTCQFGRVIGRTFLKTNSRDLETKKMDFARLLTRLNLGYIFYTYCICRMKSYKKKFVSCTLKTNFIAMKRRENWTNSSLYSVDLFKSWAVIHKNKTWKPIGCQTACLCSRCIQTFEVFLISNQFKLLTL